MLRWDVIGYYLPIFNNVQHWHSAARKLKKSPGQKKKKLVKSNKSISRNGKYQKMDFGQKEIS